MNTIILSTDRLNLRVFKEDDLAVMTEISMDPKVMEFFPSLQDRAVTEKLIQHCIQHQQQFGYSMYAVERKDTDEFIGFVGLNQPGFEFPSFTPKSLPVVEIGWRLGVKHWNLGFATEAARAVLDYAHHQLALKEVVSFTAAINLRSRKVMEKIGMHHNPAHDFDYPKLDVNSPLRPHVLYLVEY